MVEETISREFRLKNIDEERNYLIEEIKKKGLFNSQLYLTLSYFSF